MADLSLTEKRRIAGRKGGLKGGRARVKKGFAKMPANKARAAGRRGTETKRLRKEIPEAGGLQRQVLSGLPEGETWQEKS